MTYNWHGTSEKCRSILKHALIRCDNHKSCCRPVVSLLQFCDKKSYCVNWSSQSFPRGRKDAQFSGLHVQ